MALILSWWLQLIHGGLNWSPLGSMVGLVGLWWVCWVRGGFFGSMMVFLGPWWCRWVRGGTRRPQFSAMVSWIQSR